MTKSLDIDIPYKLSTLYTATERYIVLYGGRGSGKSWGVAQWLILKAFQSKIRVLCAREIQNSIRDSVHKLLADTINLFELGAVFKVTDKSIICTTTGSEFIFKGLHRNDQDVKSTEGINICWIEEAQSVSRASLDVLIPTIRAEGSQIIFTYNPTNENDPVHVDFTLANREDTLKIEMNYDDNPFLPEVLINELEYCKRVNYEKYLHVWQGQCRTISEACVFKGKFEAAEFEAPDKTQFFYGADFGFSVDPSVIVRFYVSGNNMFIDYEAGGVGIEITEHPSLYDSIPGSREHVIKADNARPEIISYLRSKGFKVQPSKKGKGSIEEGIEFLRSFEKIYIHPRCKRTLEEFTYYSYKVDKLTGEILPVLVDSNNHIIDALRYGSEDLRRFNSQIHEPKIKLSQLGL